MGKVLIQVQALNFVFHVLTKSLGNYNFLFCFLIITPLISLEVMLEVHTKSVESVMRPLGDEWWI